MINFSREKKLVRPWTISKYPHHAPCTFSSMTLKPVVNWPNVCSPNILRTARRTMSRFLIELLVRRTWFGQSKLYFVLNWFVMRCKLRPELALDSLIGLRNQLDLNSFSVLCLKSHMGMRTCTVVLNQTASPFPKRVPGTAGRMCIWPIGPSGVAATRFVLRRKKAILSFRQAPCAVDCNTDEGTGTAGFQQAPSATCHTNTGTSTYLWINIYMFFWRQRNSILRQAAKRETLLK